MPNRLVAVRMTFCHSRLGWSVTMPSASHASEPTVNTTKPYPVIRLPRFDAVIKAAMVVATGATQLAMDSMAALTGRNATSCNQA